jgi:GNAT superfamily N-acetyltransferase
MTEAHVREVVRVHLEAFPGFFLSTLGFRFLEVLYREILEDPSGIGFVCVEGNAIRGFVAGTDAPAGLYRRLLRRRWWRFGAAALVPVLRNPFLIPRLLNAFRRTRDAPPSTDICELMSMGVATIAQGQGLGGKLMTSFLSEAARRGRHRVVLTTDHADNERTNHFYIRQGFQFSRLLTTAQGRMLNEYMITLDPTRLDATSGSKANG